MLEAGVLIAGALVAAWLWWTVITRRSGFGEITEVFTADGARYTIRQAARRDTSFAAVTVAGHECGTITTGAFWSDIERAARNAAIHLRGAPPTRYVWQQNEVNIYVLPGANWRRLGGLLAVAIMQARDPPGADNFDAHLAALPFDPMLSPEYKARLRSMFRA